MKRAALLAAVLACLVGAWSASAATSPLAPGPPSLTEDVATAALLTYPKVAR